MLDKIFLEICNMSFTASYIILAVIFVRLFLEKAPKIFSYSLWSVVLFRLLCPLTFESAFSIFSITKTATEAIRPFPSEFKTLADVTNITQFPNNTVVTTMTNKPIFENIFTAIWIVGTLVMLIYSVITLVKLKRKLIGSVITKDNVYISDYINSPFVMGFIKPKIYLPSNLEDSERDFIIKHEMTHIKRLDHITRILAFIALSLHWFNPFVWVAFVLSNKDMEISCDQSVMKKMDTDIRVQYSKSLLKFGAGRKFIKGVPLAFGESDTKSRIKNVLKYKKPMVWVSAICVVLVSIIAVSLMSNAKNNEQDLSLLNPKILAVSAHQLENNVKVTAEDDTFVQVSPEKITKFLDDDKLKRKNMDVIELIPSYTFNVNDVVISLYEFEPDLVKLHFSSTDGYRYYTKNDIYSEFVSTLDIGTEIMITSQVNDVSSYVINTATSYVQDFVDEYNQKGKKQGYKIIEATITKLEKVSTGTANNDNEISLYKLEYLLKPDNIDNVEVESGMWIHNDCITELSLAGQPYFLFYDDFNDDSDAILIETTNTEYIFAVYGIDYYLEQYGTAFTAYAMETYNEYMNPIITTYEISKFANGEEQKLEMTDEINKFASDIIFGSIVQSAAWTSEVNFSELSEYYVITQNLIASDDKSESHNYYVYKMPKELSSVGASVPVVDSGMYTLSDVESFDKLCDLF